MASLILKGFKAYKKAIDPKLFGPILEKHVGRATRANGIAVRRRTRAHIRAGAPTREGNVGNAPFTQLLKKGNKPIVGTKGADLFNAITWKVEDWKTAVVGAIRMQDGHNIAEIVHNGRVIPVSEDMRGLFWLLWLAKHGRVQPSELNARAKFLYYATDGAKGIVPISKNTKVIVIPSRPFLKNTMEDPETISVVDTNWANAVKATIKEQAKKGMKV